MSIEKFKHIKKKIDLLLAKRAELAKEAVTEGAKEIFKKHPIVESFGWCAYTPHFNDGDTCYFGVHNDADSIRINDERGDEYEKNSPERAAAEDVEKFLELFDDDTMLSMFGDHVEVEVTPDGVATSAYDHD